MTTRAPGGDPAGSGGAGGQGGGAEGSATQVTAVGANTFALPSTAFTVVLDRYLDPATVSRQALCVQSSTADVRTLEDCTAGLLLRPSYDPVRRRVTYHQETATSRLAPQTLYRITVLQADEATGDYGFRAFDGAPLAGRFVVEFFTDLDDPAIVTESPPVGPLYCGTPDCLASCEDAGCRTRCSLRNRALASCASAGCHASADDAPAAAMGLDFTSAAAIEATALGQVAHQTQRGPGASRAEVVSGSFGRSMPIVSPGDPGRSYLLYKILASPDFAAAPDLAAGETDRLRDSVAVGLPMPPNPYTVPDPEQLDHLVQWIAAGADLQDCP